MSSPGGLARALQEAVTATGRATAHATGGLGFGSVAAFAWAAAAVILAALVLGIIYGTWTLARWQRG